MNFAEVVRSSDTLRGTFSNVTGLALWWKIVLVLHGKPVTTDLTEMERGAILVRGFRFYGYLYLSLGIIMSLGFIIPLLHHANPFSYWPLLSGFASLYLIGSAQLAFQGSRLFGSDKAAGAVLLIAFFVCIIAFLCAFGAILSLWAHGAGGLFTGTLNIVFFAGFILFGVGSYFIELIYLAWRSGNRSLNHETGTQIRSHDRFNNLCSR